MAVLRAQGDVVGHEGPGRQDLVEHGVAAVADVSTASSHSSGRTVAAATWPARPATPARRAWPAPRAVCSSRCVWAGHLAAQHDEQVVFALVDLLLGRQHLFFVFLQFRRDVALGVLEGLLAQVVGRHLAGVGVGDLDVIAEDLVVADLQAGDAGAGDFLGLEAGDPFLAVAGDGVQFIQLRVVAGADDAALARAAPAAGRRGRRRAARADRGTVPGAIPGRRAGGRGGRSLSP